MNPQEAAEHVQVWLDHLPDELMSASLQTLVDHARAAPPDPWFRVAFVIHDGADRYAVTREVQAPRSSDAPSVFGDWLRARCGWLTPGMLAQCYVHRLEDRT